MQLHLQKIFYRPKPHFEFLTGKYNVVPRGVARIFEWGDAVERQRREKRGAEGVGCGEGVSPSPSGEGSGEGTVPPPRKILII